MDKKPEFHGSDLEQIEAYYHIPKEEIVSFGANVNPLGLSEQLKKDLASYFHTHPEKGTGTWTYLF